MDLLIRVFATVCVFLFASCSGIPMKDKITNFRIFQFEMGNGYMAVDRTYEYSRLETESQILLKYQNPKDSFGLKLLPSASPRQCVLLWNENKIPYSWEDMKVIKYNGVQYNIIKFTSNVATMDGETTIFVDPDVGLLIHRNDNWIYSKELTSYMGSAELGGLVSLLKEDAIFYLHGNHFTVPEPPPDLEDF